MHSYQLKRADTYFQRMVGRIAKMAGIEMELEVYVTDIPSSCTTLFLPEEGRPDRPVICYNPAFTDQLEKANPWALTAAFAQEIARFCNQNIHGRYNAELKGHEPEEHKKMNADKFTGWVLWHEGVQLKDAMILYNLPKFSKPYSFLGENQRKTVMKAGWIKAHERLLLPPKAESLSKEETRQEEFFPVKQKETNDTGGFLLSLAALAFLASGMSTLGE